MDYQRNDRFSPTCHTCRTRVQPQVAKYTPTQPYVNNEAINTVQNPTTIAMVFSPKQCWQNLYEPCKALSRGTLFADLDKPFNPCCH